MALSSGRSRGSGLLELLNVKNPFSAGEEYTVAVLDESHPDGKS